MKRTFRDENENENDFGIKKILKIGSREVMTSGSIYDGISRNFNFQIPSLLNNPLEHLSSYTMLNLLL